MLTHADVQNSSSRTPSPASGMHVQKHANEQLMSDEGRSGGDGTGESRSAGGVELAGLGVGEEGGAGWFVSWFQEAAEGVASGSMLMFFGCLRPVVWGF
jgi:hypothetical protein